MSRFDRYIIERRDDQGALVFDKPQPEDYFGSGAREGMTTDQMAKVVFRHKPNAVMTGMDIPRWPANIHPQFIARRKTW